MNEIMLKLVGTTSSETILKTFLQSYTRLLYHEVLQYKQKLALGKLIGYASHITILYIT